MATHSSVLAWRSLCTEEPGRLQSMGLQRMEHNLGTFHFFHSLDSTYKWYHMIFVFFFLTSLSMTISRSICVARNDIISFFFYGWVVLLPGKSHGWRSLVGYGPWGRTESDMTEWLHFSLSTFMHWRRKWQPTLVFLPGESQGRGSLLGCCLRGRTESDTTEATWQQQQYSIVYMYTSSFRWYLLCYVV